MTQVVQPLAGDGLELPEEMQLGGAVRVAPMRVEQAMREIEQQRRLPQCAGVDEVEVYTLADAPFVARLRRPHQRRCGFECVVGSEIGSETLLRQFDHVAIESRKPDLERITLGRDRFHLHRRLDRLRLGNDWFGGEVEGNAE